MTDNQTKQVIKMMTQCVTGIQELQKDMKVVKSDVSELKSDVAELKSGQARIEKAMDQTNRAFDTLAGESVRVKNRVEMLERDFSN